jgi:hypothetical protein
LFAAVELIEDIMGLLKRKDWQEAQALFNAHDADMEYMGNDCADAIFFITAAIDTIGALRRASTLYKPPSPFDALFDHRNETNLLIEICRENNWNQYRGWARFYFTEWCTPPNHVPRAYLGGHHFHFRQPPMAVTDNDNNDDDDETIAMPEDDDYDAFAEMEDDGEDKQQQMDDDEEDNCDAFAEMEGDGEDKQQQMDDDEEDEQQQIIQQSVRVVCPFPGCRHVCFLYEPPAPMPTTPEGSVDWGVPWPCEEHGMLSNKLTRVRDHYGFIHSGKVLPLAVRRNKMHALTSIFKRIASHLNPGNAPDTLAHDRAHDPVIYGAEVRAIKGKFQRTIDGNPTVKARYSILKTLAFTKARYLEEVQNIIDEEDVFDWTRS